MAAATNLGTDLQSRIFAILDADAALDALIGADSIFDHVPDDEGFPFVVIGDSGPEDWNTHTFIGFQGTIQLRIWTQDQDKVGRKECADIMSRIWTLLNNVDLTLPNRVQINFRCASQGIITEQDNRTYQGQMNFDYIFGGNET